MSKLKLVITFDGDVSFRRFLHRWKALTLSFRSVKTSSKIDITSDCYGEFEFGFLIPSSGNTFPTIGVLSNYIASSVKFPRSTVVAWLYKYTFLYYKNSFVLYKIQYVFVFLQLRFERGLTACI